MYMGVSVNTDEFNGCSFNGQPDTLLVGTATDYLENRLLDHIFRNTPYLTLDTLYIALFTNEPTDTGSGIEVVAGSGYTRVAITPNLLTFSGTQGIGTTTESSGTSGLTSNNSTIVFGDPTGDWGRVTNFALYDAPTYGNMLVYGYLVHPKTLGYGDPGPKFPAGTLNLIIA